MSFEVWASCALIATLSCGTRSETVPAPSSAAVDAPHAALTDPCGGAQELLKKYLSASPCVFVRGQAGVQATYAGTNVPMSVTYTSHGHDHTLTESTHSFGYPGALLHIGITPTSEITIVLPSFSQINSSQTGTIGRHGRHGDPLQATRLFRSHARHFMRHSRGVPSADWIARANGSRGHRTRSTRC